MCHANHLALNVRWKWSGYCASRKIFIASCNNVEINISRCMFKPPFIFQDKNVGNSIFFIASKSSTFNPRKPVHRKISLFLVFRFLCFYSASLFQEGSASKHAKCILHAVSNVDRPAKVNLTLHEPRQIDYYIVILILPKWLQFYTRVRCRVDFFYQRILHFPPIKWTSCRLNVLWNFSL